MNDKLSVSAICNGTVIDHIPEGQAIRIVELLSLLDRPNPIMIGVHLKSTRLLRKDLLKIENCQLTEDEANKVMAFAPSATINLIEGFQVVKKISARLPESIHAVFICPNPACITRVEPIETVFHLAPDGRNIFLTCHFCEKSFNRDTAEVRV